MTAPEFRCAAIGLAHGHIHGMCRGLTQAGAQVVAVADDDAAQVDRFRQLFPQAAPARCEEEILDDPRIRLIASAAVPSERGPLGCRVLAHGKDFFSDKAPFTSLEQLAAARAAVAASGGRWAVYYSERLHVACAVEAGDLLAQGAIGRVLQVIGLGPHRLDPGTRPTWFFRRSATGGILVDLASHQIEQFLFFSGARSARILHAAVANYDHPQYPELEDWGQVTLVGDNGATGYHRVDWLTPAGLDTWGDGRLFLLGTSGYIELRKYTDPGTGSGGDHLILVDGTGMRRIACAGREDFPFFGRLIRDCLDRTETAMPQAHAFAAAELSLLAQQQAQRLYGADRPPGS